MRIDRNRGWAVLAALGALLAVVVPELGTDAWPFHPPSVQPHGLLGPVARAAGRRWDLGFVRTPGTIAALLVAVAAAVGARWASWRASLLGALALVAALAVLVPAVVLQAGLRQATHPWIHVNDSTYQIELAGDLVRHGRNPYGYDYTRTGLDNWYPAAGLSRQRQVALHHFAYFPGTPLTAGAWDLLPRPLDDYRFFVLLCTVGLFFAALAFPGPVALRIALGAALAANPLAARAAWFGTADAPSLLAVFLAFALVSRRRFGTAGLALGVAVALKQFALVAVPFLAVMLVVSRAPRASVRAAAIAFALPLVATFVPFIAADPGALWRDTVSYGASTYRIIGYGLSSLWVKVGLVDNRFGPYPFVWLALLVWLPLTLWLLWNQLRTRALWFGAAAFSVSMFVLLFISRVFHTSYLVWPFAGIAAAVLLAHADDERVRPRADVAGEVDRGELEAVATPR